MLAALQGRRHLGQDRAADHGAQRLHPLAPGDAQAAVESGEQAAHAVHVEGRHVAGNEAHRGLRQQDRLDAGERPAVGAAVGDHRQAERGPRHRIVGADQQRIAASGAQRIAHAHSGGRPVGQPAQRLVRIAHARAASAGDDRSRYLHAASIAANRTNP